MHNIYWYELMLGFRPVALHLFNIITSNNTSIMNVRIGGVVGGKRGGGI